MCLQRKNENKFVRQTQRYDTTSQTVTGNIIYHLVGQHGKQKILKVVIGKLSIQ